MAAMRLVADPIDSTQPVKIEVTKTAVSHRPGAFKAELSKLVIVAKAARSEL